MLPGNASAAQSRGPLFAAQFALGFVRSRDALMIAAIVVLIGLYAREKAMQISSTTSSTGRMEPAPPSIAKFDQSVSLIPFSTTTLPSTSPTSTSPAAPSRFLIPSYGFPGPVPWEWLRPAVQSEFTLNGQVAVQELFFGLDKLDSGVRPIVWSHKRIDVLRNRTLARNASAGICVYGAASSRWFFEAFDAFPVSGKSVLVIGSQVPWAEAMCLAYNASTVTTVDFNKPTLVQHSDATEGTLDQQPPQQQQAYPGLRLWGIDDLDGSTERFDVIVSYSSLEHDGLGRYGDPLNPFGDIMRMQMIRGLLKPNGVFFLGVPAGNDTLVFNAHRIYGPRRMPMLTKGWRAIGLFGAESLERVYETYSGGRFIQPIMVLKLET